ncbi:hypothetical protein I3842_08G112500 [Carya illinoinensis]|uniref:Uncharacterized protein n=1 Tax=Carya illinoinensis TaxID=32201 RepID=A0A922EBC5_CARIL|nr:hypothetical protein I3842_08G112500 [Carya illinoinensis]
MVRSMKFSGGRVRQGRAEICRSPIPEAPLPPQTRLRDEPESNDETQDIGAAAAQEAMGGDVVGEGQTNTGSIAVMIGRDFSLMDCRW